MKDDALKLTKDAYKKTYKNWFVHNVVAHPLMQLIQTSNIFKLDNLEVLAIMIHDETSPKEHGIFEEEHQKV